MKPLIPFVRGGRPLEIHADVWATRSQIEIEFRLGQGAALLSWPDLSVSPTRRDHLWERTCFEAFLLPDGGEAYWEINASPSGDWNIYRFDRYREGMKQEMRLSDANGLRIRSSVGDRSLQLSLDRRLVPELERGMWVGLTAVLEFLDGTIEYWALSHAGGRPDFHLRESFVQRLI